MAAITWAVILAVLIPLVLIIAFVAYKVYKKFANRDKNSWQFNPGGSLRHASSRTKLAALSDSSPQEGGASLSPPVSSFQDDEEFSPAPSDRSSGGGSNTSSKKRRILYDKVYRTHEPLEGLPEIDFENKQWDPNEPQYEPEDTMPPRSPQSDIYAQPFADRASSPLDKPDLVRFRSNPSLVDKQRLTYTSDDYTVPIKTRSPKERAMSQSSIITDV